jgi:ABC-type uncharacterized transport system auxiliary subunit
MRRAAFLLCAVAAAACSTRQPAPRIQYYTLTVPGPAPARPPGGVEVARVTADPPYDTARIAYRVSPYRLDYYVYHRWAADPPRLVAMAIRDWFGSASPDGEEPFVVSAHLRRLEEVDAADGWRGAFAVDVRVERGGRTVLARSFDETEPAEGRTPEAVAAALSRALGRVLAEVTSALLADGRDDRPPPERRGRRGGS